MIVQAYVHGFGVKDSDDNPAPRMPEPYYFVFATIAFAVTGLISLGNERLGVVLAWGTLLGTLVYNYDTGKKITADAAKNANISAAQITTSAGNHPGGHGLQTLT